MRSFPDKNAENDFVLGLEHGLVIYEKERSKDIGIKKRRKINPFPIKTLKWIRTTAKALSLFFLLQNYVFGFPSAKTRSCTI